MTRKPIDYILLAAFFAGLFAMFMPSGESAEGLRTTDALWNLGHPVLFFLAGYLAYAFYPAFGRRTPVQQILLLVLAVLAASGASELLQSRIPGRFPSYSDIIGNLAGIIVYLSVRFRRKPSQYVLLHAAAACLAALILWPFVRAATDDIIAYQQFPVLADFETPFESRRFENDSENFKITSEKAFHGKHSLRIHLDTSTYSGIALKYMPRDWSGFSRLRLAVFNPQPRQINLTIRIHDTQHETSPVQLYTDRYNQTFRLPPETWTPISIGLPDIQNAPADRQLNLSRIQNLGMFVTRAPEQWTLYLDYIRLT